MTLTILLSAIQSVFIAANIVSIIALVVNLFTFRSQKVIRISRYSLGIQALFGIALLSSYYPIAGVLFFIVMYGIFDGLQTVIADKPLDNIIKTYCTHYNASDKNYSWYFGSNKYYSPSWFWSSNPWHMCKWGRLYSMSAAIGIALTPVLHWWSLAFPLIAHIEGIVFIIGYHRIFRTGDTRLTWKEVLTHIVPFSKVTRN